MGNDCDPPEMERVLKAAEIIAGSRIAALAWTERPLPALGNQSPAHMVTEGRADAVLAYLASIESGFLG